MRSYLACVGVVVLAAGCGARQEAEILGQNAPPDRVALHPEGQQHPAPADETDDALKWAGRDLVSDRFSNMAFHAQAAERTLREKLTRAAQLNRAAPAQGAEGRRILRLSLADAITRAARNSRQLRAFGMLPAIRATAVREAEGRFTPEAFVEARVGANSDDPTSIAQIGGEDRLREREAAVEAGVRARLRTGAELTVSQRFSSIDSNKTDYQPGQQAAARSAVTVVQPLLRGAGLTYNNAATRVAELDAKVAQFELLRQAESHMLEVERAYWALATARKRAETARRLAAKGGGLAASARSRGEIDADPTLDVRASAASARWRADQTRARAAVRNAQLRLAALTESRDLADPDLVVIPTDRREDAARAPTETLLARALEQRPEVQQAFLQYRAAVIREGVAANEALPELDLIAEASFSGRDDGRRLFRGTNYDGPGGMVGLRFSVPIGYDERAARAERRRLETIMQRHQTGAAVSTAMLELEISANEREVADADLAALRRADTLARRELSTLRARWRDGGDAPAATLDALIGAEERAARLASEVAQAEATVAIAEANLARASGGLLERHALIAAPRSGVRDETIYRVEDAQ